MRTGAAASAALTWATIVFFTALPLAIRGGPPEGGHYVRASGDGRPKGGHYVRASGDGPPEGGHYVESVVSGFSRTLTDHDARTGYIDGAPGGFSGGFGEQSCHGCHFSADVNTPPGQVMIEGVPARFTPGQQYPITIALTRPGMKLGGFQIAARFKDGGAQAGSLEGRPSGGERVKFETQGGIQYASQTLMGAAVSEPGTARWTVVWTAPTGAAVQFHVSANAADGDESAQGDYVYTAIAETTPQ